MSRRMMKTRIAIAAIASMLSTGSVFSAEISPAECASIRQAVKLLVEEIRDASAAKVDVNKALLGLMVEANGQQNLIDGIADANDKLRIKTVDTTEIGQGIVTLNNVCPG